MNSSFLSTGSGRVAASGGLGSRQIGLLALVAVMYLTISGGAYGIEDAVRLAGPGLAVALCLLVPATVGVPTALMAAELTALFPLEGGFYVWVKEGLGPFAGFAEAYLTILYTAVDMALYPVLFASYLAFVLRAGETTQLLLGVAMVWMCGLLNIAGVRPVGKASFALMAAVLLPFIAMVAAGFGKLLHRPDVLLPSGTHSPHALGLALAVVIWNFCGWENLSVVAEEIKSAQRTYLRAMAIVMPLVVAGYLLPVAVGAAVAPNPAQWHTGSFADIGARLGAPYLGRSLALGGMISAFAIFQASMLWVSRMPFVLAREGYLPLGLAALWRRGATPARAIVVCCVVCTALLPLGFATLVLLDVTFYMAALGLEMVALWRLRSLKPIRPGLFVIPGGRPTLFAVTLAPLLAWGATFAVGLGARQGAHQLALALFLAGTVWPAYLFCRRRYGGPLAASGAEG